MLPYLIATALVAWVAGVATVWIYARSTDARRRLAYEAERRELLDTAATKAGNERDRVLLAAKEEMLETRMRAENQIAEQRRQITEEQRSLAERSARMDAREETQQAAARKISQAQTILESEKQRLVAQSQTIAQRHDEINRQIESAQNERSRISGMSRDEAVAEIKRELQRELEAERGGMIKRHLASIHETADAKGREILLTSIQRFAATHTADSTTGTVDVPGEEIKGRIIGREGRNIRTFEQATGVDVIIDDTPGVVIVSSFDPVRREVGRRSLQKLIADGRIHPTSIEETVRETAVELDEFVLKMGREAADEVNVSGLNEKVLKMLGRLYFRTSYSQNVLRHSIEVAFIAGLVAEMLGYDADTARRCGLLHDIGKAADHDIEGGHPKIGADLLRRNGEDDAVVHAAGGHHDDIVIEYPYTMLTAIGDACSAARPGARRESLERYVRRMKDLEEIAGRFEGVASAFAVSAGRELRVILSPEKTDDARAAIIARDVAKALEEEMTYPGQIRVTVIRESRFHSAAR